MVLLTESKLVAWLALVLAIALVVMSMLLQAPWWGMIAEFFCFIAVFSHLAAVYLRKMSRVASRKLDVCALVCLILSIVAFIVEYIVFECI